MRGHSVQIFGVNGILTFIYTYGIINTVVFFVSFVSLTGITKVAEVALPSIMPYGGIYGAIFITIWIPIMLYVSWQVATRVTRR